MNEGSGAPVLWILAPLFVAVGLYLIWYSRHRKRMLEAFAEAHQFIVRPGHGERVQNTLDNFFIQKRELAT
jgi:hypothetical protein